MAIIRELYASDDRHVNRDRLLEEAQRCAREGEVVFLHGHAKASDCASVIAACFRYEGNECTPWEGGKLE
jgi:hypothetical protein